MNGINLTDAVLNRSAKGIAKHLEGIGVEPDIALHTGYVTVQNFVLNTAPGSDLQAPFTHLYKRAADALEAEVSR